MKYQTCAGRSPGARHSSTSRTTTSGGPTDDGDSASAVGAADGLHYIGHPYYVSGNAILHALGQHLDPETHAAVSTSHGVFVLGQFGTSPEEHSQSGIRPSLGSDLPDVEVYDDLFLQREAMHPWLLDTRARDALNTHDLRVHGGHPALAHETIMDRREDQRKQQQTTKWCVHAYLHADDPAVLPLGEDVLEGLQFGGKRNYGYGEVQLKDTQMVDLDEPELDDSRLESAKARRRPSSSW